MGGGAPGRPRMLRARWLPMMDGMLCIACLSYVRLNNSSGGRRAGSRQVMEGSALRMESPRVHYASVRIRCPECNSRAYIIRKTPQH